MRLVTFKLMLTKTQINRFLGSVAAQMYRGGPPVAPPFLCGTILNGRTALARSIDKPQVGVLAHVADELLEDAHRAYGVIQVEGAHRGVRVATR